MGGPMSPKHTDIIPQTLDIQQALKGVVFNNCTPQGTSLKIKPDSPQLESNPLQLEQKDPIWISVREAKDLFGLSEAFFYNFAKRHPELACPDNEIRTFFNQEAVRRYLEDNPKHKLSSLCRKKLINIPMLAERAYQILKDEGKELYPDCARIPTANRERYISYAEMVDKLKISYGLYYNKVRPLLYKMISEKPKHEQKEQKELEDKEWQRFTMSWDKTPKIDK